MWVLFVENINLLLLTLIIAVVPAHFMSRKIYKKNRDAWLDKMTIEEKKKQAVFASFMVWLVAKISIKNEEIEAKFIAAGIHNTFIAQIYLPCKYLVLVLLNALVMVIGSYLDLELLNLISALGFVCIVVIMIPDGILNMKVKGNVAKVSDRLPFLLDLMSVCVRSGMTIEAALTYLAEEMVLFDQMIAYLLTRTMQRTNLVGLEQSLEELNVVIPSKEMRSFVMTLTQSLHYGTSISDVLATLAADIREMQILEMEEKIGKLGAKMSMPLILFIMLPIVILIVAPGIMRAFS
ncbi:Type II/IV secretion system protein TadC [Moritella sp. JT01]|uniref:type II secretion system F family protein n=1 Tax=Moritella sp. JT01 TaxID=756698 RepID=UPI00079975BF|nr:type II secretion system F family protein [Moritella sp. JT01]KXO11888.1 Type II/IV secretion system protein TadC [Moritella sp. JT01]